MCGVDLGDWGNVRQAGDCDFDPRGHDKRSDHHHDSDHKGRSDPDSKTAIAWVVQGCMSSIKGGHDSIPRILANDPREDDLYRDTILV